MKRYNFTINEMLAVIAIIMVLAGLLFPTLSLARERAKATSCAGNQGQVSKILLDAMSRFKDKLISNEISKDDLKDNNKEKDNYQLWTTALYKRNLLSSLDIVRCPAFEYTIGNDIEKSMHRAQAYGVVVAKKNEKLNFASKKNRIVEDLEISPNKMLLGGCAADKWGEDAVATAALDFNDNKLTAIHRGEVNVFFLDGSVMNLNKKELDSNNIYYPDDDNSKALKVTESLIFGK